MIGYPHASSALTFLVLLTGASFLHLSSSNPNNTPGDVDNSHRDATPEQTVSGDGERKAAERRSTQKEEAEEDELFKDVDPKTLAAVLLQALNHSQVERVREGEGGWKEEETNAEMGKVKKEEAYREVRTMKGADRDRDGRQELELLMAAQGKEQEREEEEERKKALEEEEKMTEKVTSHTTSQTVQVQTEHQPLRPDGRGDNAQGAAPQLGPNSPEQGTNDEEEQLSPEELKSLETMMKEFPSLNTAVKREGDSEQNQRESRGYSSYNDIIPINKGSDLAMSKKKLKWQEETQKALNFPTFRGGNFMDVFEDSNYAGSNAAQSPLLKEQEVTEDDEPEEEEEESEEVLSPEEEEALAKAEQEEMRRQAAEAQRAKMEEEKLADIASDMLLRYMVKQNNGNRKYSSSLSNAVEDKRSDEKQEVTEEDDIDPQTIDKLIEISSKLHLPADDVVDIISDVEKKKKKDVPSEITSHWKQPLTLMSSSSSSSANGFPAPQISTNQNSFPTSHQPSPAVSLLKTWFQDKSPTKLQDLWSTPAKPLQANQNLGAKPQKPLSIKQGLKSPKSVWAGYPFYPYRHQSYYQRKSYPDYYPIYFHPPPRPKPHYYISKPPLTLNNFLGNSLDDTYIFPPKRYSYYSWVQPRRRNPPAGLKQKPYYTSYPLPLYPWIFQPVPRPHSPPHMPLIPPQQKQFYWSAPAATMARNEDYYVAGEQPDSSNRNNLEKYVQQMLMKRSQMLD